MKTKQTAANVKTTEPPKLWQKTSYANLIRYTPSGMYFCRIRVQGRLIRKSLKTDVLSVAKLRLTDEEKRHRQLAQRQMAIQRGRGQMTFGDALKIYHARLQVNPDIKSKTKDYYSQRVDSLLATWPGLERTNVRDISKQNCLDWSARYEGSSTAFNNTALVLRAVLDIAIESGVIYENMARHVTRRAVRPKELDLPGNDKFAEFVQAIENGGGRFSHDCADLVRFLAYGGFRLGEAKNITWADCDLTREEIIVRGDPDEGTKNSEIRRVPIIAEMRELLERLRQERPDEPADVRVMRVTQSELAMKAAEKKAGIAHLTHHDLRHLFATRCIESGVDIPTVSRWLGHKDGGALAMKVYGHLRNQHSASMAKLVNFAPAESNIAHMSPHLPAIRTSHNTIMNKVTAVIDKSLLQKICEQPEEKLDAVFNAMLERYILLVPEILVEEVWVNWANPSQNVDPKVVENMVRCLLHLRDAWIAEPLEIAFVELVKRESIELLPKPPQRIMDSFYDLRRDNPALIESFKKRRQQHDGAIRQRVQEHASILDSKESVRVTSKREVFEKMIRPKFLGMLSDPVRKKKLLEGVLGLTFRARHPGCSQEIDSAFESYSLETFDKYHATLNCIMTAMFYFYTPLCKIESSDGNLDKILGRGFGDQKSNLNDEKYVQSALLCARLATRDQGMCNIMDLFRASGLWNGRVVFVNPQNDLATEIPRSLV